MYPKLIENLGMLYPHPESKQKVRFGRYECPQCSSIFKAQTTRIMNHSRSICTECKESNRTPLNLVNKTRWSNIKYRCMSPNHSDFDNYGGRGITIHPGWILNFNLFNAYIMSLPNALAKDHTLDRVSNNYGYHPMNLRWATHGIQAQNKRLAKGKNKTGYRGVTWLKNEDIFLSNIGLNKKQIYLGRYKTAREAALAYDKYIVDNLLAYTLNFP